MNWYSAKNFCESNNGHLVTLTQLGLGSAIPSGQIACAGYTGYDSCNFTQSEWSAIRTKFGNNYEGWTADAVSGNSCSHYIVFLQSGSVYLDHAAVYDPYRYAICR